MATRKPLVVVSGTLSELPPNDYVEGAVVTTSLTAGSGLTGGGSLSTNQRIDVSVSSNPSGLIFTGNTLGLDGVAQRTADAALISGNVALASGNAALSSAAVAQASGNAALSRAGGTMTGPIIFANGQQINTAVNLSGGISGAVAYQSAPSQTAFLNPGVSGQVLTTAGSGTAPTWSTPANKFLQAVQGTLTSSFSTSSASYVSTGLSATITPSSASNRIIVVVNLPAFGSASYLYGWSTIYRNGSNLVSSTQYLGAGQSNNYQGVFGQMSYTYIDSPATTSSCTYAVYVLSENSAGVRLNYTSYYGYTGVASIQLFEVV